MAVLSHLSDEQTTPKPQHCSPHGQGPVENAPVCFSGLGKIEGQGKEVMQGPFVSSEQRSDLPGTFLQSIKLICHFQGIIGAAESPMACTICQALSGVGR